MKIGKFWQMMKNCQIFSKIKPPAIMIFDLICTHKMSKILSFVLSSTSDPTTGINVSIGFKRTM